MEGGKFSEGVVGWGGWEGEEAGGGFVVLERERQLELGKEREMVGSRSWLGKMVCGGGGGWMHMGHFLYRTAGWGIVPDLPRGWLGECTIRDPYDVPV